MQILPDLEFRANLLKKIEEREFNERSGVHCSDLIYCLNKQALRKLYPEPPTEEELLLFSLGWASQRWLTGADQDAPEVEVDGIKVTPDALLDGAPWELKCTYQSSTRAIEETPQWVRQIMAQCWVMGKNDAHLSRMEIMGNWKWVYRPSKPEKIAELVKEFGENWDSHPTLSAWHLGFTNLELKNNWEWLKSRRDLFLQLLAGAPLLPKDQALPVGQDYECEYCHYREQCPGGAK